ncbi:DUF6547 family protein [Spirochaeta isovalerica]|uniref:Uncharacterized protein n=1 Tax=Spirochaeta isovalerica TaxID=150 RepID=A0A841RH35_9SPIO|nr:DUF6547 family protein [Spirochaeta isovalerica]MBB6482681.1 hypothetical protein [Spirochaeta isovalerica]
MNKRLEYYKQFIDDLVKLKPTVLKRWVLEKGWPKLDENKKINKFLSRLKQEDKEILCELLQQARDGGIHDTLVYLNEKIILNEFKLYKGDTQLAVEPYGTELFWDWVARSEGDEWPEHQLDDDYKT